LSATAELLVTKPMVHTVVSQIGTKIVCTVVSVDILCWFVCTVQGVDFKRLWKVHECVAVINLASERCDSMKLMFEQAMKSTAFLRSPEVLVCVLLFYQLMICGCWRCIIVCRAGHAWLLVLSAVSQWLTAGDCHQQGC